MMDDFIMCVIPSLKEMLNENCITLENAYDINETMGVVLIGHNGKFEIGKEW